MTADGQRNPHPYQQREDQSHCVMELATLIVAGGEGEG